MSRAAAEIVNLEDLVDLAGAAGRAILAVREAGFTPADKADGSPVTRADHEAEAVIEAGLARLAPGVPVIGEEAVAAGTAPAPGPAYFCVDALDGTRDFVAGAGEFTVNIAFIADGAPVMGVVLAPALGEVFAGEPGRALKGRWDASSDQNRLEPIRAGAPGGPWRVVTSRRSGATAPTERFIAALGAHERAYASSSIKFCRLAEGAADLYPRFGEVSEWDAAAGHAILVAAGGAVIGLDGAPLSYGADAPRFRVRGFIACASEAARMAALDALIVSPSE